MTLSGCWNFLPCLPCFRIIWVAFLISWIDCASFGDTLVSAPVITSVCGGSIMAAQHISIHIGNASLSPIVAILLNSGVYMLNFAVETACAEPNIFNALQLFWWVISLVMYCDCAHALLTCLILISGFLVLVLISFSLCWCSESFISVWFGCAKLERYCMRDADDGTLPGSMKKHQVLCVWHAPAQFFLTATFSPFAMCCAADWNAGIGSAFCCTLMSGGSVCWTSASISLSNWSLLLP